MAIQNKNNLKNALTALVRSGGQNGKTKAQDVRTLLTDVIDTLFSRANNINGVSPDPETGAVSLTGIPLEVHQQFVVNPNLDTTDVVYLESGPVTFRTSNDTTKISALSFRTRLAGTTAWSAYGPLTALNTFAAGLTAGQKYEVEVAPVFTAAAAAAGEDIRGLLIY